MNTNLNRFIKTYNTFFKYWDFYGIILINSGKKTTVNIDGFDYQVPLIKIHNPNNLPYTIANLFHSFKDLFLETVQSLASTDISYSRLLKLIKFDTVNDNINYFYLGADDFKKIKDCIQDRIGIVKYRNNQNIIYTIEGRFDTSDMELYMEDSGEILVMDIGFETKSVYVDNLVTRNNYMMDSEDFEELIYHVRYEDRSLFEDPIWPCVKPTMDLLTFLDTNWQFIDFNIRPI